MEDQNYGETLYSVDGWYIGKWELLFIDVVIIYITRQDILIFNLYLDLVDKKIECASVCIDGTVADCCDIGGGREDCVVI